MHNKRYVDAFGHNHINSAESFHAILKRGHYGVHHQYAPSNVILYAEEAAFRWNRRREKAGFGLFMELALAGRREKRVQPEPWPPRMDEDMQRRLDI